MTKRSKSDSSTSSKEPERTYIAKPLSDGSYRLEPDQKNVDGPGLISFLVGGAIILLVIWWLISIFLSNVFNFAVKRDFGWSQYWENIVDFYGEDKCYFFAPMWFLDEDKYIPKTLFVPELPPYPFKITTTGIEQSQINESKEHEDFVKSNFKHVLIDGRPPVFMKFRGSRQVTYRIEGDKFLPLDFETTWSAVSIYGTTGELHGYLRTNPDKLSGGDSSFEPGIEYDLNTRDHRSLIAHLKAEDYFGDPSEQGNRYAVVFNESCVAMINDRR